MTEVATENDASPLGGRVNRDLARGVATLKPSSPIGRRKSQTIRQKKSAFSRTTAATPQEVADAAFLDAVAKGSEETVRSMIDEGQDVNVADERGESALYKAVATGDSSLVQLLLKHFALVDHADLDGVRPIGIAIKHGHAELVNILTEAGSDLRLRNPKDGTIFLHEACWGGHTEMVQQMLLTGKFDDLLETTDANGRTPLHVAAFRAPEEVCRALIRAGANASVMDKRLNLPSSLAGRMGRRNSKDYLENCELAATSVLAAVKLMRPVREMREKAAQAAGPAEHE